MKQLVYTIGMVFSVSVCIGQWDKEISNIANTINTAPLKKHLYTLASDEMEGRSFRSQGEKKAAKYISSQFKNFGLLPGAKGGWEQTIPLYEDSVTEAFIAFNKKKYKNGKDFSYPSPKDNKTQDIKAKEIVFVGYGISDAKYDSYRGIDVKGKIVLMYPGEPMLEDSTYIISGNKNESKWGYYKNKITTAIQKGAIGVLIIDAYNTHTNKTYIITKSSKSSVYPPLNLKSQQPQLNCYFISTKLAADLLHTDTKSLKNSLHYSYFKPRIVNTSLYIRFAKIRIQPQNCRNVIAILEGTDKKEEYVFITAHFDHKGKRKDNKIYYGADDNASGTAALLEIAAAFARAKRAGFAPRRSIVFIAFGAEENGLWGSKYYIERPIYPLSRTIVNLNMDMMGRIGDEYKNNKDSANYIYTIGDDSASHELKEINERMNSTFIKLKLDKGGQGFPNSDQRVFVEKNIPVILYYNGRHEDYHAITDTPDKINYELLAKRARLVFHTAWEIANREERLKVMRKRTESNLP